MREYGLLYTFKHFWLNVSNLYEVTIMSDKKEIFADGFGQIHFAGGMVRFDLMTLQPGEEGKAPVPESKIRLIMPPQGFLSAFNSMQQLIDKLVAAGVVKKNENQQ